MVSDCSELSSVQTQERFEVDSQELLEQIQIDTTTYSK